MIFTNQLEAAKARLKQAEQGIQEGMPAEQARAIRDWVLANRAGNANVSGDILYGVSLAHQALDRLPETAVLLRMGALVTTAHAFLANGDVTPESEHAVAATAAVIRAGATCLPSRELRRCWGGCTLCRVGSVGLPPPMHRWDKHSQGKSDCRSHSTASSTISPWGTCCASGTS